ncbi:hypothetical protein ISG33_13305 [Glaciecola sp. MH2013]|nr:hypothetical protein [Glaciecola sp. MH2013]
MNDILDSMGVIDSVLLVSFGLVAFMICLNYITYSRFIQDGAQNIRLDLALDARNKALENLCKSLENKVTARTQELADANTLLSELVVQNIREVIEEVLSNEIERYMSVKTQAETALR